MSVYCVRKFFDCFRRGRVQSNGRQSQTLKRWWDLLLSTGRAEGLRTRILEPDHKSMFFEPATDGVIIKRTNIRPSTKAPVRFHPDSNRKPAAWRLRLIAWRLRIETAISVVRFPPPFVPRPFVRSANTEYVLHLTFLRLLFHIWIPASRSWAPFLFTLRSADVFDDMPETVQKILKYDRQTPEVKDSRHHIQDRFRCPENFTSCTRVPSPSIRVKVFVYSVHE